MLRARGPGSRVCKTSSLQPCACTMYAAIGEPRAATVQSDRNEVWLAYLAHLRWGAGAAGDAIRQALAAGQAAVRQQLGHTGRRRPHGGILPLQVGRRAGVAIAATARCRANGRKAGVGRGRAIGGWRGQRSCAAGCRQAALRRRRRGLLRRRARLRGSQARDRGAIAADGGRIGGGGGAIRGRPLCVGRLAGRPRLRRRGALVLLHSLLRDPDGLVGGGALVRSDQPTAMRHLAPLQRPAAAAMHIQPRIPG